MEWKSEYAVQIPGLDRDHQILVGCVTELEQAVAGAQPAEALNAAIKRLMKLARTHFNDEVDVMRIRNYEGIDAHIQDHKAFLAQLETLERQSRKRPVSSDVVGALHEWLERHLLSYDKDYATCFANAGK